MSNGEPFDETKTYKVAMNSYRGNGGGELLTKGAGIARDELGCRIIYQSERDQRHYIMLEIEKAKHMYPKAKNNWRFVPEEWTREALKRDRKLLFND
jgi:2',3'-cyclic-nucleotide 2'-phosphodiesterase/3'-nucleotidase